MDGRGNRFRLRMVRSSASYGVTRRFLLVFIVLSQLCISLVQASSDGFHEHVNEETRSQRQGLIQYVRFHKLYSRCSGKQIQIVGKHVNANGRHDKSTYTELRLESVSFGYVRISSTSNNRYLCFNKHGRLTVREYGHRNKRCVFKEILTADSFTELQSDYNPEWYVGFRQNGKPLRSTRRRSKPHCFQFTKQDGNKRQYVKSLHGPDVSYEKLVERVFRTMRRGDT